MNQQSQFQHLLSQRHQGQPIAYLTGSKEFWSRNFCINSDVLIPRPETELIVELALKLIPDNQQKSIIDMGTGSGVIAITLAAEKPNIMVTAVDKSQNALNLAKLNADKYQLQNIHFLSSNWFNEIEQQHFDMVISNPPYIAAQDPHLQQGDLRFEPGTALIAKKQGLHDITQLANTARQYLKPGGYLLLEHGYNQQQVVQSIIEQCNYSHSVCHRDLAGHPRVTCAQWLP